MAVKDVPVTVSMLSKVVVPYSILYPVSPPLRSTQLNSSHLIVMLVKVALVLRKFCTIPGTALEILASYVISQLSAMVLRAVRVLVVNVAEAVSLILTAVMVPDTSLSSSRLVMVKLL